MAAKTADLMDPSLVAGMAEKTALRLDQKMEQVLVAKTAGQLAAWMALH